MAYFAKPISVNGFTNLFTAMRAAGYLGGPNVPKLQIVNNNATVVYIHLTQNAASSAGLTGTDGIEVSTTSPSTSWSMEKVGDPDMVDLSSIWLFSGGVVSPKAITV